MRDLCCIFHYRMSVHVCSYSLNVIICMFVYTYTSMNWPIDQVIEVYILTPPASKKFSWAFCICHLIYLYISYSIRCPSCFLKLWRQRQWIPASVYKLSKIKRTTGWNCLCFKVYHFLTWNDQCSREKKIQFPLLYLTYQGGVCFIYFLHELFCVKNKLSKSKSHSSELLCKISAFKRNQNSPLE